MLAPNISFDAQACLNGFWEAAGMLAVESCAADPMEFSDDDPNAGIPGGFAPSCVEYCNARLLACWQEFGERYQELNPDSRDATPGNFGCDYFLTCERHGTGFWDVHHADPDEWRALCVDVLTPRCHADGEFEFYAGDDRLIYCMAQYRAETE